MDDDWISFANRIVMRDDIRRYSQDFTAVEHRRLIALAEGCRESAARSAKLKRRKAKIQTTGDGEMTCWPAGTNVHDLLNGYLPWLHRELQTLNSSLAANKQLRLRLAITETSCALQGVVLAGDAPIIATRLVDSEPCREALERSPSSPLAVIIDEGIYRNAIEGGQSLFQPEQFVQVDVQARDKGFATKAWMIVFGDGGAEPPSNDPDAQPCPYPGLAGFTTRESQWFFGRERLVAELVNRVADRARSGGPLMVVAPSGAGKSSLLQAGLLSAIRNAALPVQGSSNWPCRVLSPGQRPLHSLAQQLATLTDAEPSSIVQLAQADGAACADFLRKELNDSAKPDQAAGSQVVLIIDQFEELFTHCADPAQRSQFVDTVSGLAACGPNGEPPVALVVCGLRADFYAQCVDLPELRASLQDGQVVVGPMTPNEVRDAVLLPAEAVGLDIEPGLVELLLRDLALRAADAMDGSSTGDAYAVGCLPLLAHALRATWQQRQGNLLTVKAYQVTGGIQRAVARTADDIFTSLSSAAQRVTRTVLLRLIRIDARNEHTRRRMARADLLRECVDAEATVELLDAFTRGRLLVQDHETVEITHDALLTAWPRLRGWIEEDRAGNLVCQDLQESAAAWDKAGRDSVDLLYRGTRLRTAEAWAKEHDGELSETSRHFIAAARRQQRRSVRWRRGSSAALALFVVLALVSGVVAWRLYHTNESTQARDRQRRIQVQNDQLISAIDQSDSTDPSFAAELYLIAYNRRLPIALPQLLSSENTPLARTVRWDEDVSSVAYSPDGRTLASGDEDGTIQLWNVENATEPVPIGPPLRIGALNGITALAFSPDGTVLVSGSFDGTVRLWDVTDTAEPTSLGPPLTGHKGSVTSLALSPDGRIAAVAGLDGTIQLWNIADAAKPSRLGQPPTDHVNFIMSVAFSPDGHFLASASFDGKIQLWDVADPAEPLALGRALEGDAAWTGLAPATPYLSVTFSRDGHTLIGGSNDGTIQLWDLANPARPRALGRPLIAGGDAVGVLTASADGRVLASAGADGTVRLWTLADPAKPIPIGQRLAGHTKPVTALAFSPDGRALVSAGHDGTIRFWDLPQPVLIDPPTGATAQALSRDGRVLACGSTDGTVRLWSLADPAKPIPIGQRLAGHTKPVTALAFSPDGRLLADGADNGVILLWDVSNPHRATLLPRALTGHTRTVTSVAFSPNGNTLASGSSDGTLLLWDITDRNRPSNLPQPSAVDHSAITSVAFSPNAHTVATGGADGKIRLWNVTDPDLPTPLLEALTGHADAVTSVAFSEDGKTLASGSRDDTVRLWNVEDPNQPRAIGQPLTGHTDTVTSVAFSPDGTVLASGSDDGTIRFWVMTRGAGPFPVEQPMMGLNGAVDDVAFGPKAGTFVSRNANGTIQVWDAADASHRICAVVRDAPADSRIPQLIPGLQSTSLCP